MDRDRNNLLTGVLLGQVLGSFRKPAVGLAPKTAPAPQAADGPRYIFDPLAARSAGNTFRLWSEVVAAIAAGQTAPTVVFARPGQYQIAEDFNLRRGKLASLTPATGTVTVSLADDVQIDNAAGIEDGLQLVVRPNTRPSFSFSDFGATEPVVFAVSYGAALQNLSTTSMQAFPLVAPNTYLVLGFFTASQRAIAPSTAPLARCTGGSMFGGFSTPFDGWAQDVVGSSMLQYQCDSTFPEVLPVTPGFLAGNVLKFQASLSRSVAYTASNPADWMAWANVVPDNVGQALDLLAAKP